MGELVRLRDEGPAVKGLLRVAIVSSWVGVSAASSFLMFPILGWVGVYLWLAGNVFLAYMLNESRKHSRANVFDDRLSPERIDRAEKHYIEEILEKRNMDETRKPDRERTKES